MAEHIFTCLTHDKENREELTKINKPIVKISTITKEGIEDLYNEILFSKILTF